jgi:hypothetical protein
MATGGWFSSLLGRDRSEARDQMVRDVVDDDDDWCDVPHGEEERNNCEQNMDGAGGQCDETALKSTGDDGNNSIERKESSNLHPSKPFPSCQAAINSQYPVPPLFSLALPPCGPHVQVAYENVVHRLRAVHLQATSTNSSNSTYSPSTLTTSLCQAVLTSLTHENQQSPAGTQVRTGRRTPWRSEVVFRYEIAWAKYFVREAQMLEQWPSMTEQAREKQDFANRMYLIPKELGLVVKKREMRDGVLELWMVWHEGKRGGGLRVGEDREIAEGGGKGSGEKVVKEGGEKKEIGKKDLEDKMNELEKEMNGLKKGRE